VAKFVDADGGQWVLSVTVNLIREVRTATGFDIATICTGEGATELARDVVLLVDVIYAAVAKQAQTRGLGPVEFANAIRGQTLDDATTALLDACIEFLPPARGQILAALRDKLTEGQTALIERQRAAIAELTADQVGKMLVSSGAV